MCVRNYYYYYYYYLLLWNFFTQALADVFSLEFEWEQVSSSLQDSSQYFGRFWMISARPLISMSSSHCTKSLVTVSWAPITIGITVTYMFHSFSIPNQGPGIYLSFRFRLMFSVVSRDSKVKYFASSPFIFADYYKVWSYSRDLVILLYFKFIVEFVRLILLDKCWVVHIPFVRMVNFTFLHHSQWVALSTLSCLILYSFCANLLHSLVSLSANCSFTGFWVTTSLLRFPGHFSVFLRMLESECSWFFL